MKKVIRILFLVMFLVLLMGRYAYSANTDNHTVTVTVDPINELAITGGNVTLTIDTATAGSEPTDATDNTTADLDWTTNQSSKKITIVSNLASGSQNFTLLAVAQNVTGGTAASQVTVDDSADDFVTGVATTTGGCDIQYTGQATVSSGTGSDVHTITFTLTDA